MSSTNRDELITANSATPFGVTSHLDPFTMAGRLDRFEDVGMSGDDHDVAGPE